MRILDSVKLGGGEGRGKMLCTWERHSMENPGEKRKQAKQNQVPMLQALVRCQRGFLWFVFSGKSFVLS